jgi:signal transduction histidine kinase
LQHGGRLTLDVTDPAAVALRTGEIASYESEADRAQHFGNDCAAALEAGIVAPLSVDGRSSGILAFAYAAAHKWTETELALAASLSHQCAQALDRAQLYASERVARAAAEEANRAKSDFLSVMSHELRTPLNSVLGYADLLLMQVNGSLTETQKLHIARIQVSARHQLALVEEILGYARLEAGREHLRVAPVDVGRLLREVEEFMRPEAEQRGITLRVDLPLDEELKLITDPGKLRQIALNLTANALKFTREGGAVLGAGWDDDGWLMLRVEDTGPGIPADLVDTIWQPFTQLDSSSTREIAGAGLGLAIVRRLVEFMGGQISVDTEVGRGSTFTVRLPRTPPLSVPR